MFFWLVARVEIAALQDLLPDAPEIAGHGHTRVHVDPAWLRCERAPSALNSINVHGASIGDGETTVADFTPGIACS